jgi:acetyltransferase
VYVVMTMHTRLIETLEAAFHPRAIAVVGASPNPPAYGYLFVNYLLQQGYQGHIYPVHLKEKTILGLKVYPSISDIPEPVDYLICCISGMKVPDMLAQCSERGVKVVHLCTARLAETGRKEGQELEAQILERARKSGVRLIGPNCMGLYYPQQGIAFAYDLPREPGKVGAIFQSAGLSHKLVRYGSLHGIRFSKVISYGNALDINESDLFDYLSQDNETEIIAAYIEGVKDGERFFTTLRNVALQKPTIVLKGGRGKSGAKSAASHTAAIAGSRSTWEAAIKQAGAIPAQNLDEFIDLITSFYFLPPIMGRRVGVIGGGGGCSVLGADECEEAGLEVIPLPSEIRDRLRETQPLVWDWIGNPADASIMEIDVNLEEIRWLMAQSPHFDFLICNITVDAPYDQDSWKALIEREVDSIIEITKQGLKPITVALTAGLLSSEHFQDWRWNFLAEQRQRLLSAGLPIYSSIAQAASAINKLVDYYQRIGTASSENLLQSVPKQ